MVSGQAHLTSEGTDDWAAALLQFDNGIIAEVSCSVFVNQENVLRILGSTGRIEVPNFWFANGDRRGGEGKIDIIRNDGTRETVSVGQQKHLFSFEADAAAEAIFAGRQELPAPGMTWADSLGNARVLDKWRADAGIEYSVEKPAKRVNTLSGRPLNSGGGVIPSRSIPGISKTASVVALGFEDFRTFASGAILLDAFYERGGRVFDTAFIYAAGYTEKLFGDWQKSRGVREESVLIGKGAHTPLCYPDVIAKQLDISETAAKVRLHRARHKLRELLFGRPLEIFAVALVGASSDGSAEEFGEQDLSERFVDVLGGGG